MAPAYTRLRIERPALDIRLTHPITPAQATALADLTRSLGLRATILTDPTPHRPGRNPAPRLTPWPQTPMSRRERERIALSTPSDRPASSPESLHRELARLVNRYGADVVLATLHAQEGR